MKSEVFQKELRRRGPLHGLAQRYTEAMINQISQSIVCNHRHSVEKRMCRWLLMSHDRVGTDGFPLTHEFLAQMLGVRRPTVTAVAGTLQKAGLITYHRGEITVLERKGLEGAACECYEWSPRSWIACSADGGGLPTGFQARRVHTVLPADLAGCSDETKVKKTETIKTPEGKSTITGEKKVETSGKNPRATP